MVHPPTKPQILFYSNGLTSNSLQNIGHAKVNDGRKGAILNLIESEFFKILS